MLWQGSSFRYQVRGQVAWLRYLAQNISVRGGTKVVQDIPTCGSGIGYLTQRFIWVPHHSLQACSRRRWLLLGIINKLHKFWAGHTYRIWPVWLFDLILIWTISWSYSWSLPPRNRANGMDTFSPTKRVRFFADPDPETTIPILALDCNRQFCWSFC